MTETVVMIDGMMCGMCESHINDVVRKNFNVKKVSSSHSKGRCVILSEDPIDESKLRDAINTTGYEVKSFESSPAPEKHGLFGRR